jgi:hypothetical protein
MQPSAFQIKRKGARYHLLNVPDLRGGIGSFSDSVRLITMGEGGCGFISKSLRLLHPPLRIECLFEWRGFVKPISVGADLLYSFVNTKTLEEASYYGVEFAREDRHLLSPIIQRLGYLFLHQPQSVQIDRTPLEHEAPEDSR